MKIAKNLATLSLIGLLGCSPAQKDSCKDKHDSLIDISSGPAICGSTWSGDGIYTGHKILNAHEQNLADRYFILSKVTSIKYVEDKNSLNVIQQTAYSNGGLLSGGKANNYAINQSRDAVVINLSPMNKNLSDHVAIVNGSEVPAKSLLEIIKKDDIITIPSLRLVNKGIVNHQYIILNDIDTYLVHELRKKSSK